MMSTDLLGGGEGQVLIMKMTERVIMYHMSTRRDPSSTNQNRPHPKCRTVLPPQAVTAVTPWATPLTPAAQRPLLPAHTPRMGQATLPTLATAISMVDRQRALPNISQQVGNNISGGDGGRSGGSGSDDGGGEGCEDDDVDSAGHTADPSSTAPPVTTSYSQDGTSYTANAGYSYQYGGQTEGSAQYQSSGG